MRTLDGKKNTANIVLKTLNKQSFKEYMFNKKKKFISESVRYNIEQKNEHVIFGKVHLKYLLIKIRQKISFIAFEKRMTVTELFCNTIRYCYNTL